jgi:protein phosphatase PTC7
VERQADCTSEPDVVQFLQRAYDETVMAADHWWGTTTSVTALLHCVPHKEGTRPLLYVTNLGDSQVLVVRPSQERILFKTADQWRCFDCPLQLGTNSKDQPHTDAVPSKIELEENDIVLAVSDGVSDNLWEHDLLTILLSSMRQWEAGEGGDANGGCMVFVAKQLLKAALSVAQDPFAESPYMGRAVDEGLSMEGGRHSGKATVDGTLTLNR